MAGFTTSFPNSFKAELPQAAHCFNAVVTPTGSNTSGQFTWTSMSAVTGLVVGMGAAGTNIPASSVIASIDSTTQITLSKASTGGPNSGITLTCTADAFKCALGKASPTGTYDTTTTNYSNLTGNSDENTGTGYTTTGFALTNITPNNTTTQTFWQWSVNPNWTSATITTPGCIIYNVGNRLTSATGRAVYVGSFGGNQSVVSGTLTLVQPSNGAGTSLLQLN